jgi:O-antigen/teichoic acid export membrane protein
VAAAIGVEHSATRSGRLLGYGPPVSAGTPPVDVLRTPEAGGKAIRGGTLRGGGYAVGLLLGAVTSVFLLRGLGVEDFGRYGTVAALLGIVSTLTDAGLTAVGSRELALRPPGPERERLLQLLLGLRVLLSVVAVLAAVAFAAIVGYDDVIILGTLIAGFGVLLVNTQATAMMPLSVELRLGAVTAFEVLRQAITLVGVAFLAIVGASLLPYFLVQVVAGLVVLAVTPFVVGGLRGLRLRLDRSDALALLRDALPVGIAIAMNVLYLRLLVILVSLLQDEVETGEYATAFRIFELLVGIPALVIAVVLPVLAVAADDRPRLRYAVQRTTEVALVASVGLALATTAFAAPAVDLLFGEQYAGSVPMLQVQVWALVPLFLGSVASLALLSLRRQRAIAVANVAAVVVVLAVGLALIPVYGGLGASAAGVATEVALGVLLFVFLRRTDRSVQPQFGFAWRAVLALLAGLVPLLVPGLGDWAAAILATAVFVGAALLLHAVPGEVFDALRRRGTGS